MQLETEQNLTEVIAQSIQLQRTVWLLIRMQGYAVEIDQAAVNPLWTLKYEPVIGKPNHARLVAGLLAEPTNEQLAKLEQKLRGTTQHPADLMREVGLPDHPFSYLTMLLAPKIVCHNGKWIDRAEFDKLPKQSPAVTVTAR